MKTFAFGMVGALIGGLVAEEGGVVLGFAIGALWGRFQAVGDRLDALEWQVRELAARRPAAPAAAEQPRETAVPSVPVPRAPAARVASAPDREAAPLEPRPAPAAAALTPGVRSAAAAESPLAALQGGAGWIVEFFTTGNLVAKIGVVILLFGVAFLVRFAAERGLLPIEYRLMGVTAGALVLLTIGWRLRRSRPEYAMSVQGGAIGILYLTIFAAFRLYELLPVFLTFALLLAVVALSGVLAVAQNAQTLAVLGTGGGFLAPILASTGGGSHVGLFSYYLLLNAGVVGLAWFRSWRLLNWLGFVFTFGVGLLWGARYYEPRFFATTEPFLIVFFLFYVVVAVLFAHRQAPELRGYIDGSLVFGTPAIAFAMQSALVRDIGFARAYSAVAVSALYLLLARGLWRRDRALRPLAEAFLALGTVFLTLAVPFAFDGHATAAAWALEGAGLAWIGARQHRVLARVFGAALQLAAGLTFAAMASGDSRAVPVLNSTFLGSTMIATGGVLSAYQFFKARDTRRRWEVLLEWGLLVWGLLWWSGALGSEIDRFVDPTQAEWPSIVAGAAATSVLLSILARLWQWPSLKLATVAALPLFAVVALLVFGADPGRTPVAYFGWLAWPSALAATYWLLWQYENDWPPALVRAWHAGSTWLVTFLATWTAAAGVDAIVLESDVWADVMWATVPAAVMLALHFQGHRLPWPVRRFSDPYQTVVQAGLGACIGVWVLWACAQRGDPAPLSYVPFLNPLEIAQAFGLFTGALWWARVGARADDGGDGEDSAGTLEPSAVTIVFAAQALIAFAALNAVVGRIVHFYLDVPYNLAALADSAAFQAGVSVLWAMTALSIMAVASRRGLRNPWFVGASLLGLLIVKLFLVDLGNLGGIARIVSFLVTGVLILVIGYVSPVPPRPEKVPA